ncbi:MAG: PIN/TRAM domain-containing protein [Burkholderiales bacterium]
MGWDYWLLRGLLVALAAATCYHFDPFSLAPLVNAGVGFTLAVAVILLEFRLRRASLRRLIGGALGSILGVLAAVLMSLIFMRLSCPESTKSFVSIAALLGTGYIGLVIGANKGEMLNLQAFGGIFGAERANHAVSKVLDTSVIIDGRVADICEAHFLDGNILIPQFVLRELQLVADSSDPLKRQRGRRGLEVLSRLQKLPHLDVRIVDDDFPQIAEVDMKLIELAKRVGAKIVTNDFNLNKVATVQGIDILNVNQLANALKPVVLPGETMRVFILREGKEYNQGVAYLDDGTMVVVDGARRLINKTVDIIVTSVHQTTAGKMIFGRLDPAGRETEPPQRQAAAAAAAAGASDVNGRRAEGGRSPEASPGERGPRPVFPEPPAE